MSHPVPLSDTKVKVQQVKGMFLYSAVSSPLDRSKRFTLSPWQTCSFRHQLGFSGKHSSHAAIMRENYSLTFPPLSIARYSFIHLYSCVNWGIEDRTKMAKLRNSSKRGIRLRALLFASPASYRTPALMTQI